MINLLLFMFFVREGSAETGIGNLLGETPFDFFNPVPCDVDAQSVVCILVDNKACDIDSEPVKPAIFSSITVRALDIGRFTFFADPVVISFSFCLT